MSLTHLLPLLTISRPRPEFAGCEAHCTAPGSWLGICPRCLFCRLSGLQDRNMTKWEDPTGFQLCSPIQVCHKALPLETYPPLAVFFFFFPKIYLRDRASLSDGRNRGRGTSRLQAEHGAQCGARYHKPQNHDLSQNKSRPINQLSHPSAPTTCCLHKTPMSIRLLGCIFYCLEPKEGRSNWNATLTSERNLW